MLRCACAQMSLEGKEKNLTAAIRSEMLGSLSLALLDPLIKVAAEYAAEFVCIYCQTNNLIHTQMVPAARGDAKGAIIQVPVVGHCVLSQTTYVLCPLHSPLHFLHRVTNPDRTVNKVVVAGPDFLRSKHKQICGCNMPDPPAAIEYILKTQ